VCRDLETISALVDKSSCIGEGRSLRGCSRPCRSSQPSADAVERDELARRHGAYLTQAAEAMAGMQSWPVNPRLSENSTETWQNLRAASPDADDEQRRPLPAVSGSPCPGSGIDRGHRHERFRGLESAALAERRSALRCARCWSGGSRRYFVVALTSTTYTPRALPPSRARKTQRVAFLLNRLGRIFEQRADLEMAIGLHPRRSGVFEAIADNGGTERPTLHLLARSRVIRLVRRE